MSPEEEVDSDTDDQSAEDIEESGNCEDQGSYEIRGSSVMECITKDSVIALYSPSSALELFYLCKVIKFGTAIDELKDDSDHVIQKGQPYIQCKYFEKVGEKA